MSWLHLGFDFDSISNCRPFDCDTTRIRPRYDHLTTYITPVWRKFAYSREQPDLNLRGGNLLYLPFPSFALLPLPFFPLPRFPPFSSPFTS